MYPPMKTYVIIDDHGHHLIAARSLDHALAKQYGEWAIEGADDLQIMTQEMHSDGYNFHCEVILDGRQVFTTIQHDEVPAL
jgi:hypothetical protein